GVAMGKATDIAKNAGDVVLVSNDLRGLLEIYELSRRVNRIALENLAWAFVYNAVLIPIAAGALYPSHGILLKPEWAALAMILSDISVVANSLRLIAGKPSWRNPRVFLKLAIPVCWLKHCYSKHVFYQ
ncbi:MAG: hypothetical protein QXM53_08865, partial [Thermofilaceae archaeon]